MTNIIIRKCAETKKGKLTERGEGMHMAESGGRNVEKKEECDI